MSVIIPISGYEPPTWRWVGKRRIQVIRRAAHRLQYGMLLAALLLGGVEMAVYRSIPPDRLRPLIAALTGCAVLALLLSAAVMPLVRSRRAVAGESIDINVGRTLTLALGLLCGMSSVFTFLCTFLSAMLIPFVLGPASIAAASSIALGGVALRCSGWFRAGENGVASDPSRHVAGEPPNRRPGRDRGDGGDG